MSEHSTSWDHATRDEADVRRGFWSKATRVATRLPFAEDLAAAYYCAFDTATPIQVRAGLMAALAYFVLPLDAIPDLMAGLGYTDDAAVLLGAMKLVSSHILPEHRAAARRAFGWPAENNPPQP